MSERNFSLVRQMGSFNVLQRTSDGMFNASSLLKQWNAVKGNQEKRMDKFLKTQNTKEFIEALCDELLEKSGQRNYLTINGGKSAIIDYQQVIKTKKGITIPFQHIRCFLH